jgi:quercetin dioxygenase-like cupin family protein
VDIDSPANLPIRGRNSVVATFVDGVDRGSMEIKRVDTQASATSSPTASAIPALSRDKPAGQEGSQEWFTGKVWIQPLFEAPPPSENSGVAGESSRIRCASVTFEPCARTAWHTHPLGQTLIVTSGQGWAQREGGPIEEIRPGDVVWFGPNEKHWHGAMPTSAMSHVAIQEALDGKVVDWMEQVSEAQYGGKG